MLKSFKISKPSPIIPDDAADWQKLGYFKKILRADAYKN